MVKSKPGFIPIEILCIIFLNCGCIHTCKLIFTESDESNIPLLILCSCSDNAPISDSKVSLRGFNAIPSVLR